MSLVAANLILGARVYLESAEAADKDDVYANIEMFSRVLEMVRQNYVDGSRVTYEDLINGAMKGMLNTLDPHSEFMEPRKFNDLRNDTAGEFGGIGVVVTLRNNVMTVIAPMDDTPGSKAGLQAGDQILRINGQPTERLTLNDAIEKLRGKAGTDVTITVRRPSTDVSKDHKLTRAVIAVKTVRDLNSAGEYKLLDKDIGYLRISTFGDKTNEELEDALKKLTAKGMKGLVIDLRDNPGGLLDQAVFVAEKFLPTGQLILTTEGRGLKEKSQHKAAGKAVKAELPIAVLVNGGSASASEIVAGCLQDLKRAILVGEKTFGKGSVQSILPLKGGAALRLTTAKYYTPSHREIHDKGIMPDHVVSISFDAMRDLMLRRSPGGLEGMPEIERERILKTRDTQLDRAVELLTAPKATTPQAGK
ncbi:MAG: S41 family peptidase [Pedosphaera sp.]|nr:S41 family peptidase [Pedosphaera sp.]